MARTRRLWLVAGAALGVPAALSAFQTYMFWRLDDRSEPLWRAVAMEAPPWLVFAALTPVIWWLGERLPIRRGRLVRALAVHGGAALIGAVLYAATAAATSMTFSPDHADASFLETVRAWFLFALPVATLTYFGILGVGQALGLWSRLRERELQAAKLSSQLAEAKLSALRMQLHPHFLFNSLNAIGVLVRDRDSEGATRMLTLLAELLRQVLTADGRHEVPLGEELGFARRYLAIEQVRFSDRLDVTYQIDEALLDVQVPCFVVQPLVENALRHGMAPRARGGNLEVGARAAGDAVEIWVRDDGVGLARSHGASSNGVGLANTRARLAQLYGDAARLAVIEAPAGGVIATIHIPRVRA